MHPGYLCFSSTAPNDCLQVLEQNSEEILYQYACLHCVLRGRCNQLWCGCHSFTVLTVQVGISAHRPQHILCLKTDTELTSFLSLSHILWPTFNGKSQRFVVRYWKLSLWLRCTIVDNSCSKSFLSLSLSLSVTVTLSFSWCCWKEGSVTRLIGVFLDTEGKEGVSCHFTEKVERRKTNVFALNAGWTTLIPNFWSQFHFFWMSTADSMKSKDVFHAGVGSQHYFGTVWSSQDWLLIRHICCTDTTVPPDDVLWQPADQWKVEVGFAGLFSSLSQWEAGAVGSRRGKRNRWREENDRKDKGHSTWRWARAVSRGGIWGGGEVEG